MPTRDSVGAASALHIEVFLDYLYVVPKKIQTQSVQAQLLPSSPIKLTGSHRYDITHLCPLGLPISEC